MPEPAKKTTAARPKKAAAHEPADHSPNQEAEGVITASDTWARLTQPFPPSWVEKLPKPVKGRDDDKGRCQQGTRYSADGHYCGGWHARSVHLDYVGHAGITMRLNDVLGPGGWDFQPMATTPEGLPIINQSAFWAKLSVTVDGETVTKWELAANFNGPQEALGDALRRCAMRLGIGTYLWAKSEHAAELAAHQEPEPEREAERPGDRDAGDVPQPQADPPHILLARDLLRSLTGPERATIGPWWDNAVAQGSLPPRTHLAALTPPQVAWLEEVIGNMRQRAQEAAQQAQQEGTEEYRQELAAKAEAAQAASTPQ